MESDLIRMPDLKTINRASMWLGFFRALCDDRWNEDGSLRYTIADAMRWADEEFGFTPPRGSLSEQLTRK